MILDRARAKPGALGALRLWILGFGAVFAATLAGCSANTKVTNGTPVVTVTAQAAGDFSTYVVGLTLYSATRKDGYVAYPAGYTYEEFADLTQRVDLTELLNAVGIPTGTYTSVEIGIDFTAPIVYIKGQTTAAIVEDTGQLEDFGIVYINVKLDPANPLVINLNQSTPFALDFDLAAMNTIDGDTVTVRPFVEATATPNDTEQVRARGLFVIADPATSSFIEDIRPFEDNIYSTVGALTVNTTPTTYFNIDGKVLTGSAGLAVVAELASNVPIEAYGSLTGTPPGSNSTITPGFTATSVYAGTVVSNGEFEHVRGIITGISGDTITVGGATYLYYEGYCLSNLCFTWLPTATIDVASTTVVTQDGVATSSPLTTQALSVGSQIDAVGLGTTNGAGALTLDATEGLVRLQSTPAWGTLVSGASGSATLDLLSMGNTGLPASDFTFAGTGTSSANDASAASYEVDTTSASPGADQSATPAGTLVRVDGFPTAFGSAPPDFDATDVIAGSSYPADLVVEWAASTAGALAPFTSYDSSSLVVNLADTNFAYVATGPQAACSSSTATPACIPLQGTPTVDISGAVQFATGNSTLGISMFSSSSDFANALSTELNGSNQAYRLVAIGSYDAATNTFTASRVDLAIG